MPERRKPPQPAIVPEVAALHDALLFRDGSARLPDGNRRYFETRFPHPVEEKIIIGNQVTGFLDAATMEALIRRPRRRVSVEGRCFSTRGDNPRDMGHFIHDMLSRIHCEDPGAIAPGRERIIAPLFHVPVRRILFEKVFAG